MPGASKAGGGLEVADEYKSAVAYTKQPFGEDATQPSSFKLRSGNTTPFKLMGSSPFTWPKWLGGKGKTPEAAPQPKVAEASQAAKTMMEQQQVGGGGGNVPPHTHDEGGGIQGGVGEMVAQAGPQPPQGGIAGAAQGVAQTMMEQQQGTVQGAVQGAEQKNKWGGIMGALA